MKTRTLGLACVATIAIAIGGLTSAAGAGTDGAGARPRPIPVIFDTDIGDDIDDTWALALLLKSPELDLKLIVTDWGKAEYRARLVAKMLEVAQRTDVPVGLGVATTVRRQDGRQSKWLEGYDLAKYPGRVHQDGVTAMIELIMSSPGKITLISVGPVPNLREALARKPEIAERIRFVGMYGSLRKGPVANPTPVAEWNVRADVSSSQVVFTATWPMLITPLDTCGAVQLRGTKYRTVVQSRDPVARAVIENYEIWTATDPKAGGKAAIPAASSILFDAVAVYLAFSTDLVELETLPIRVTDDGFTRIDAQGKQVQCATAWKSLPAFEDLLVERLTRTK